MKSSTNHNTNAMETAQARQQNSIAMLFNFLADLWRSTRSRQWLRHRAQTIVLGIIRFPKAVSHSFDD
jgi:hypothetical protein